MLPEGGDTERVSKTALRLQPTKPNSGASVALRSYLPTFGGFLRSSSLRDPYAKDPRNATSWKQATCKNLVLASVSPRSGRASTKWTACPKCSA